MKNWDSFLISFVCTCAHARVCVCARWHTCFGYTVGVFPVWQLLCFCFFLQDKRYTQHHKPQDTQVTDSRTARRGLSHRLATVDLQSPLSYLSVHTLSADLTYLSVCLSIRLFVCMSICMFAVNLDGTTATDQHNLLAVGFSRASWIFIEKTRSWSNKTRNMQHKFQPYTDSSLFLAS